MLKVHDTNRPSQTDMVLLYLQQGYPLTPLEALQKFGCLRLSGRIYDLRKMGYDIWEELIETPGGKHVAEYRLAKGDGETGRKGDSEIAINESEKNG
jgi:hypothetical protein